MTRIIYVFLGLVIVLLQGCAKPQGEKEMFGDILVGKITREQLENAPYGEWFAGEYKSYTPKKSVLDQIEGEGISEVDITLIMATWCGDAKREVPRFYKLIDALGVSSGQVDVIAVDNFKLAQGVDLEYYGLKSVPTIIFYKNGEEIGRIVESPEQTIEEDVLSLLKE